jgi:outer membrane protein TolC
MRTPDPAPEGWSHNRHLAGGGRKTSRLDPKRDTWHWTLDTPSRPRHSSFVIAGLLVALIAVTGCARFRSKPLVPAESAERLQNRSLTNSDLKLFLERNLHRELAPWPVDHWDFDLLMLAALYYQPTLEVARADWHLAQGGEKTAAGRPNPTVSAGTGYDNGIANNFSPWLPWIIFDLPIETAGKRRLRMEQSRALSESARLNIATAAWQVRSDLRTSLMDFGAAVQRTAMLQSQVNLEREIAERLSNQLQAGAIASTEVTAARVALARAGADLAAAERSLATARARVAEAIGIPAAALEGVSLDFDWSQADAAEELSSAKMRTKALQSRTDILSTLSDYAASQSALQLEIAKQYPNIHLNPGYLWNQGNEGDSEWQLGLTVELPVLNQNQGPIAEAEARRAATAARFLALQAKVIAQIERAVALYNASRKSLAELQAVSAAQKTLRDNAGALFKAGATDRLELLNAELALNTARLAELDEKLNWEQALGTLEDGVQRPLFGSALSAPAPGSELIQNQPTAAK